MLREPSRAAYLQIVEGLRARGAEAVIEACTEITLLGLEGRTAVPLFDRTAIHAEEAVAEALGPGDERRLR